MDYESIEKIIDDIDKQLVEENNEYYQKILEICEGQPNDFLETYASYIHMNDYARNILVNVSEEVYKLEKEAEYEPVE